MIKAFLEPTVLKSENENLIRKAFSKESLKEIKAFNTRKRTSSQKTTSRKLSISDLI